MLTKISVALMYSKLSWKHIIKQFYPNGRSTKKINFIFDVLFELH